MERIIARRSNMIKIVQCVKLTFMLFKCHRSPYNWYDFYFLSCCEKAHDKREFSRENLKRCESEPCFSTFMLYIQYDQYSPGLLYFAVICSEK